MWWCSRVKLSLQTLAFHLHIWVLWPKPCSYPPQNPHRQLRGSTWFFAPGLSLSLFLSLSIFLSFLLSFYNKYIFLKDFTCTCLLERVTNRERDTDRSFTHCLTRLNNNCLTTARIQAGPKAKNQELHSELQRGCQVS